MQYTKRLALVTLTTLFTFLLLYHASNSLPQLPQPNFQSSSSSSSTNPKNDNDNDNNNSPPTDWSRFAIIQYATNTHYLCNSVMLFARLHALNSKPARLLLHPSSFSASAEEEKGGIEGELLRKARDEYNVILQPIEVQRRSGGDITWSESYTKLLAFNQTGYDRILHLDSDSTILQSMDELFLLPPATAAMPRSYWEEQPKLSSQLLLLEPSAHEFTRVEKAIAAAGPTDYDMEILNTLYRDSALVLPHKVYDVYTREFTPQRDTGENHEKYLEDESAQWNPDVALKTAKFIHFSDWPLPKPWIKPDPTLVEKIKPPCVIDPATGEATDCRDRDIWVRFHEDFKRRRKEVCGLDPV